MNNVKHNKKLPLLELLFIMYYAFLAINPKMNVQVPLINFLLIELAYAVYIYYRDLSIRHLVSTFLWCASIIALLFTFTTSIPYIGANVPNREIKSLVTMCHYFFSLVFPILLTYRLLSCGSKIQKLIVLLFTTVVLFTIIQITWAELLVNERILKSQMAADLESDNALVGGYSFVCAGPILASSIFYAAIKCRQKLIKSGLFLLCGLLIVFLSKSMYSIALLAAVLGIASCFYAESNNRYKKLYLAAPFIVWFLAPEILTFVINILDDGDTKLRMSELYYFFTTGDLGDDDLGARFNLYGRSLVAFIKSPIWGNFYLGFNPHSTAFEILASIGLLGFVPFYKMLEKSFTTTKKLLPSWSILPCLSSFGLMCLTNPIHASLPMNISLWLVAPLLYDVINQNKKYIYEIPE